ncbi:hypothetical protein XabCFBP2524_18830 [Xanthomonas axonopodis pv. begoniae]|nr:hypothetical protein XabCFBP2524_18830 [Xanthomonas axonopodis pv. begoniae]
MLALRSLRDGVPVKVRTEALVGPRRPPSALRAPSPAGGGRQSAVAAVKPLSLRGRGWVRVRRQTAI